MGWYIKAIRQSFDFHGRAHRREFWMFMLVGIAIAVVIGAIDRLLGLDGKGWAGEGLLSSLYTWPMQIPVLAIGARRLHDSGRSGWWQLLYFTIVGTAVLMYWFLKETNPAPNRWGTDSRAGLPSTRMI